MIYRSPQKVGQCIQRIDFHLGSSPLFLKPSRIMLQASMVHASSRLWFQSLIISSCQHHRREGF
uniref:Uncharacterized protein n=1 Tax=Arundo donax TaxID=35708 RepID=A0A0A9G4P1_ARUDO